MIVGVDQARTSSAPFPTVTDGAPPRVRVSYAGDPASLGDLMSDQTKGVIVVIHGYNVDSTPDADVDERDPASGGSTGFWESGTLRSYWPQFQWMMRDPSLGGVPWDPETKAGYAILHVAWMGTYTPPGGLIDAMFFNVGEATAHDAGERVLPRLIQDIDFQRQALGIAKDKFTIIIAAESLGNRVAASMFNVLRQQFPTDPALPLEARIPRMKYLSIHPALRHSDLGNLYIGDPYETATRPEKDIGELPQSALQNELSGTTTYHTTNDTSNDVLLFYSPFDKAGQIFESGQNRASETAKYPFLRHACMLGRVGVNDNTYTAGTPTGYSRASALVKVRGVHLLAGTPAEDLWHVSLFGWILPGMQTRSRPTYEWNTRSNLFTRLIGVLESDENIQTSDESQLQPIWQEMGRFIRSVP